MDRLDQHHDACTDDPTGCDDGNGRRAFLKEGLMALAALTALGATASRLEALTRTYSSGLRDGAELRYPVPAADGATIDRENKVILVRYQGSVYAFSLECPHRGSVVQWQPNQNRFYCPKHKSTFQPEGSFIQGKAERAMDRFAIRREGNEVVVDTGVMLRQTDEAAWGAAKVAA